MNLPHLAQRLFNTPLALHPSKAEVIMASVMDRFGITKIESSLAMDDDWYSFDDNRGRESRNGKRAARTVLTGMCYSVVAQ